MAKMLSGDAFEVGYSGTTGNDIATGALGKALGMDGNFIFDVVVLWFGPPLPTFKVFELLPMEADLLIDDLLLPVEFCTIESLPLSSSPIDCCLSNSGYILNFSA